jgi:hypothetical protein
MQLAEYDDDGCGAAGGAFSLVFSLNPGEEAKIAVGRKSGAAIPSVPNFTLHVSQQTFASTHVFASGCGFGGGAAPQLSGTAPVMGAPGTLTVSGAPPLSFAVLLLGFATTNPTYLDGGCPVNLDLAHVMIFQIGVTDGAGSWSFTAPLPSGSGLEGVTAALQAVVINPSRRRRRRRPTGSC